MNLYSIDRTNRVINMLKILYYLDIFINIIKINLIQSSVSEELYKSNHTYK